MMESRAWKIACEITTFVAGVLVGALVALMVFAWLDQSVENEPRGVHSVETYRRFMEACPEAQRERVAAQMLQISEADCRASMAEANDLQERIEALRAAVKCDFPNLVKE